MDRKSTSRRTVYQLVKEGQIQKAIESFDEFLSSGEAGPYDFVYVGDLLMKLDQVPPAIARYEEAIAAYARLGFNRNAIALCRKILRLDPSRLDVQRRMGDLHMAEESVGDALHAYCAFLEGASEEQRDGEEFRETLQRMGELAPQRADYSMRMSDFCRRIGRLDTALEVLTRAVRSAEAAGKDEVAAELRDRVAAISPSMLAGAAEPPAAAEAISGEFSAADERDPGFDSGEAAEEPEREGAPASGPAPARGADRERRPRGAPAERAVDRDDFRTHYQRGVVFMEKGELDQALAEFEAAARDYDLTSEQGARLQETRGRCFSALDRHREAIREFTLLLQSPVQTEEDQGDRLVLLAREYEAVGDLDEARKRLREALDARPEFPEAAGYLEQLEKKAA